MVTPRMISVFTLIFDAVVSVFVHYYNSQHFLLANSFIFVTEATMCHVGKFANHNGLVPYCSSDESFLARDSIYAWRAICYHPSICTSDGCIIKTVEVRIMKFSPYSSPIPLGFVG